MHRFRSKVELQVSAENEDDFDNILDRLHNTKPARDRFLSIQRLGFVLEEEVDGEWKRVEAHV